jgi:hypothetical protein
MNIEELEEQLRATLQQVEVIKQEIEKLKQEQSKPLLWKPVKGQGYLYPSFDTYHGKFTSHYRHRIEAELDPLIAFQRKDHCDIACIDLNQMLPILQLSIEKNLCRSFKCSNQGEFEFYINSPKLGNDIYKLWRSSCGLDS